MKKYLTVLLTAALFTVMLAGCGVKSDPQDDSASEQTNEISAAGQEDTESEAPAAGQEDTESEASAVTTNIFVPYYGTWEIKDYVTAELSNMYTDEMEAFRGQTITYQEDSILLNGENVNTGSFTYEKDDTPYDYDKLTEDYKVDLGEWWNNIIQVTKVTVASDEDFFGSQIFMADANTLWIYYEDAFFLAKRAEE